MTRIRLLYPFACDHQELPAGLIIDINDVAIARRLVLVELAEYAAPEHAVIAPMETRDEPMFAGTVDYPIIKPHRPRGRPKKIVEAIDGD
jgi:hypothetical protein